MCIRDSACTREGNGVRRETERRLQETAGRIQCIQQAERIVARLHPQPYPGDWKLGDVTRKNVTRIDAQLTAIPNVISFPVGDGTAYYHVKSERPLVLQHI